MTKTLNDTHKAKANYYVNKKAQISGDHEVHKELCVLLPERENRVYLGGFTNGIRAVKKAKEYYSNAKGCSYCFNEGHSRY